MQVRSVYQACSKTTLITLPHLTIYFYQNKCQNIFTVFSVDNKVQKQSFLFYIRRTIQIGVSSPKTYKQMNLFSNAFTYKKYNFALENAAP